MEKMRAIPVLILQPDGTDEAAIIRLPDQAHFQYSGTLRRKVEAITGGPMEHIRVFTDFDGARDFRYLDMFVHECGRLLGMATNPKATAIYRNIVLVNEVPSPAQDELPEIVGPAVLFKEKVWF